MGVLTVERVGGSETTRLGRWTLRNVAVEVPKQLYWEYQNPWPQVQVLLPDRKGVAGALSVERLANRRGFGNQALRAGKVAFV